MKVSKLLYQPIATLVFFNLAACKKIKRNRTLGPGNCLSANGIFPVLMLIYP